MTDLKTARTEWEEIHELSGYMEDDTEAWAHAHGVREGYEQAVQMVDRLTGGDGEYGPECPSPVEMMARIIARMPAPF